MTRHDTSTVTGWVEVHSGTIYDWHVDSPANATASTGSGDNGQQGGTQPSRRPGGGTHSDD